MTMTQVKADDWSLTPLSPARRSEPRDGAELRAADDKTKAHVDIFCSKKPLEGDRADAMLFVVGLVAGAAPPLPVRQPCRCRVRDWGHGKVWGTKAKPSVAHGRRLCCLWLALF